MLSKITLAFALAVQLLIGAVEHVVGGRVA